MSDKQLTQKEMDKTVDSRWTKIRRSKKLAFMTLLLAFSGGFTTTTLVQTLAPNLIKTNDYTKYIMSRNKTLPLRSSENTLHTENNSKTGLHSFGYKPKLKTLKTANENGTSIEYEHVYCEEQSQTSCVDFASFLATVSGTGMRNSTREAKPDVPVIYCKKATTPQHCVQDTDIMKEISPIVGYLNAIGALAELIFNPIVGILCSKFGHRLLFMIGSLIQIVASLIFILAPNTLLLFIARITNGAAYMTCEISSLMIASTVFNDATERGKILMFVYAAAFPLGATVSYLLGNVGYSFFGPHAPFGILLTLSIVDAILRMMLDVKHFETSADNVKIIDAQSCTSSSDSAIQNGDTNKDLSSSGDEIKPTESSPVLPKPRREGGYFNYFTNSYMLLTLLLTAAHAYAFYSIASTAPNWLTNVLHARQWQVGVTFGIASALNLITNIIFGLLVKKHQIWLFILLGGLCLTVTLIVYPLSPNIWYTLVPQFLIGVADGTLYGMTANFTSVITEVLFDGETAKAFSLFTGASTIGVIFGSFSSGLILQVASLMTFYYSVAAVVFVSSFVTLYLRTLPI